MEKFMEFLEKTLVPLADKLSRNRYLKAISEGFSILLPVIMIGAIFTLLANLQIGPYQDFVTATHLKEIFSFAPSITTDFLAVYAVFLIGKSLCSHLGEDTNATIAGILSLMVFFLLIPLGVQGGEGDALVTIAAALGTKWLGAAGLFSAMIIGLVVPTIYVFLIHKNLTIKMPESVPPTISKSFSSLVPGFIIAFMFCLVRYGMSMTSYGNLNQFIYTMLQTPLTNLGASPFTFVIFILMCSLMWFFGLHGGMIVMPFLTMLYQAPALENLEAYAANTALPNMIVKANWSVYASLGGAGGTIGLCIAMLFFTKSQRYKTLGKLALPAGLCGINEPITFGLPMVLNTIMIIPLILTPIITFGIAYLCTITGIVPPLNGTEIPLGTPVIFSGWLAGGIRVAILQIVLIAIQFAIYFPFIKVLDRQALKEETALESEEVTA